MLENTLYSLFLNINQLDALNFYNKYISSLYMFQAHVLIVRRAKLYYTVSDIITMKKSEWSKITKIIKIIKIQFYKYEHMVVKFMCEFFGCDYCVLLTTNMLTCRGYV